MTMYTLCRNNPNPSQADIERAMEGQCYTRRMNFVTYDVDKTALKICYMYLAT